jgi:hypothetical protein
MRIIFEILSQENANNFRHFLAKAASPEAHRATRRSPERKQARTVQSAPLPFRGARRGANPAILPTKNHIFSAILSEKIWKKTGFFAVSRKEMRTIVDILSPKMRINIDVLGARTLRKSSRTKGTSSTKTPHPKESMRGKFSLFH